MSDVAKKIKLVIAEQTKMKPEEITEKTKFTADLGLDSLDMVELIMELEEALGIKIPDKDAEKLTTVGEAISYVKKCLGSK